MSANEIFRSPNEHDETDEQINAIETLINQVRADSGAATDNDGRDDAGFPLRGATFSWTKDADGNIVIGTLSVEDGPADSVVSPGGDFPPVEGKQWVTETWVIAPDGTVSEG